jgi:hypothetical protein
VIRAEDVFQDTGGFYCLPDFIVDGEIVDSPADILFACLEAI